MNKKLFACIAGLVIAATVLVVFGGKYELNRREAVKLEQKIALAEQTSKRLKLNEEEMKLLIEQLRENRTARKSKLAEIATANATLDKAVQQGDPNKVSAALAGLKKALAQEIGLCRTGVGLQRRLIDELDEFYRLIELEMEPALRERLLVTLDASDESLALSEQALYRATEASFEREWNIIIGALTALEQYEENEDYIDKGLAASVKNERERFEKRTGRESDPARPPKSLNTGPADSSAGSFFILASGGIYGKIIIS